MLIEIKFKLIGLCIRRLNELLNSVHSRTLQASSAVEMNNVINDREWFEKFRDSFQVRHLLAFRTHPQIRPIYFFSLCCSVGSGDPNHAHTLFCFFISDSNRLLNRKAFYSTLFTSSQVFFFFFFDFRLIRLVYPFQLKPLEREREAGVVQFSTWKPTHRLS